MTEPSVPWNLQVTSDSENRRSGSFLALSTDSPNKKDRKATPIGVAAGFPKAFGLWQGVLGDRVPQMGQLGLEPRTNGL